MIGPKILVHVSNARREKRQIRIVPSECKTTRDQSQKCRLSALRTHFCAAIENSIFFDRNLPTDFDNLFAPQSEIARDARGVSHHCRKQRLLAAIVRFPQQGFSPIQP
jgi:hypothetical protein